MRTATSPILLLALLAGCSAPNKPENRLDSARLESELTVPDTAAQERPSPQDSSDADRKAHHAAMLGTNSESTTIPGSASVQTSTRAPRVPDIGERELGLNDVAVLDPTIWHGPLNERSEPNAEALDAASAAFNTDDVFVPDSLTQSHALGVSDADQDGVSDSRDHCANTPRHLAVDSTGCALYPGTIVDLDFPDHSATLTDHAKRILNGVAEKLRHTPGARLEVVTHLYGTGNGARSLRLSQHRSEAVVNYLTDRD